MLIQMATIPFDSLKLGILKMSNENSINDEEIKRLILYYEEPISQPTEEQ